MLLSHVRVSTVCPLMGLEVRLSVALGFQTLSSQKDQNFGHDWGNDSRDIVSPHRSLHARPS